MMEQGKSSKCLWSLPGGDRRGAPGADAGRYSMQAIGGEGNGRPSAGEPEQSEPNRRYNLRPQTRSQSTSGGNVCRSRTYRDGVNKRRLAPIEERSQSRIERAEELHEARSPLSSPKSLFSSIPSSPPSYLNFRSEPSSPSLVSSKSSLAEDVAQSTTVNNTAPAKARIITRKKWTDEINIFVLRTYLILTNLESDTRSYLTELHSKFTNQYPHMLVSKQRLGDQRRAIIRNNLLTNTHINEIREEVKSYLSANEHQMTQNISSQTQPLSASQRMKWTSIHNETIIREYLRITQLETNKTAYRNPLHQHFISVFPHLSHISEQRVADQRRLIISNKFISDDRLSIIKDEVANAIGFNLTTQIANNEADGVNMTDFLYENNETQTLTLTESSIDTENNLESTGSRNLEIDDTFNEAVKYFKNTDPVGRPYIPKQKTSKKLAGIVNYINTTILPEVTNIDTGFEYLQMIIYCAAWTAARTNGSKLQIPHEELGNRTQRQSKPGWQKRLEIKIEDLRKKIGRLTHYINGSRSENLTKRINKILETYKIHTTHEEPNTKLTQFLDTLKQKLTVMSSRLKRYKACSLRKTQNNQFQNNERKFYQNLSKATNNIPNSNPTEQSRPVDPVELKHFWANIWENPVEYNKDAEWITDEKINSALVEEMQYDNIPVEVFQRVLKATHNWKSPGSDHIHNYWYKKFTNVHPFLYNHINSFIHNPDTMPMYITNGITYMIAKDQDNTTNPAKYRPITCLQTIYKITTACISQLIYQHIDVNMILAEQQKGCRKFSQGCKEQLIIDSVVLKQVQQKKKDLYTTYIDYQKAYDSVPHSWLIKILGIYKIHPQIITFLKNSMSNWTTRLQVSNSHVETDPIRIQRGIFQGDALSPLWFCLALNPLSNILNSSQIGYSLFNKLPHHGQADVMEYKLNHLLYMDDIKLYASSQSDLETLIHITEKFSRDIDMKFGLDKCKINSTRAGQNYQHSYNLQSDEIITPLGENEVYKYLGYYQAKQILHKEVKAKLTLNFKHRLKSVLKTQLCSKNTVKAINSYAIPILTYSFGVINWTKNELKDMQRVINVLMTKNRKHHPRACVQRQILPRSEGGRGLIDIRNLHNKQISTLRAYFRAKIATSDLHTVITYNDQKLTPLNLQDENKQKNEELTDKLTLIQEWNLKSLHGRHRHDLSQPNVDKDASNEWLIRGELFPETEGFMIAIQDQVIETRNYQKYIMKIRNLPTDLCRRCHSASETIQHITGACKSIAQTDYKYRHDQVANIVHQKLAFKYKLIETAPTVRPTPYYKYVPETVLENATHKLYFDRAILTDKTTHYNRPDITLINKTNKTALIIDIAVPNTHNLQSTIAEKLSKYIDLKDEITRMWRLEKVSIIPIIISSTGIIPKQLFQALTQLDLPKNTYTLLQKAVVLNTCRIVRKFLQMDTTAEISSNSGLPLALPTDAHLA